MADWRMLGALACLALTACASISKSESEQESWDRLAQGGYVMLLPHASAVSATLSQPELAPQQCVKRDHLSGEGQHQVRRLKDGLQRHAVSVVRVLTSHDCRCIETASAVFERAEPWSIIDDTFNDDPETARQKIIALREAISRWMSEGNLALVSHQTTIGEALGVVTQPAEVLVIKPLGDAGFRLVGRLRND